MPISDEKIRAWLDRLEREARERPRRHALRLTVLAALGYLYPATLAAASFSAVVLLLSLAPTAWEADVRLVLLYAFALVAALVFVAAVLRTLWVTLPPPGGHALRPRDAKPLRDLGGEVSRGAGGPIVHEVYVDAGYNAGVSQRPRFGFWGPRKNYLVAGLAMLAALTPAQYRAVLAHEVGHLKGRHGTFSAWIYRIHHTWASLAEPFQAAGWIRWLVIGWFVRWYGEYFSRATLALRRRYEYEADRRVAELVGADEAGRTLAAVAWAGYRLEKVFWPGLLREAGEHPLPPADVVGRVSAFLADAPDPGLAGRWRLDELRTLTPITSDHPCLVDRLTALGCERLLTDDDAESLNAVVHSSPATAAESALSLLGDARKKASGVANALWKAEVIHRWRHEHGYAKFLTEKAAKQREVTGVGVNGTLASNAGANDPGANDVSANDIGATNARANNANVDDAGANDARAATVQGSASHTKLAEAAWEREQPGVQFASPVQAIETLRTFVARFPEHGQARFTLGRLLLEAGEEEPAVEAFESAMAHDSETIGPALSILLDHYRNAGRDREADPVRVRLIEHEQALGRALKERMNVGRRDRFGPHELPPEEVEKIRRVLMRFPRVRAARLVRKQVSLFADKPSYVLAVERRGVLLEDNRAADKLLVAGVQNEMPVPCAVVVLRWRSFSLRGRLLEACPEPVFMDRD